MTPQPPPPRQKAVAVALRYGAVRVVALGSGGPGDGRPVVTAGPGVTGRGIDVVSGRALLLAGTADGGAAATDGAVDGATDGNPTGSGNRTQCVGDGSSATGRSAPSLRTTHNTTATSTSATTAATSTSRPGPG
ncbi:hypothetical protein GCM10010399_25210 [Dactylosporangium fulvum]